MLDDVGFAQLGCYGSDIATPSMDRLAEGGLRYTNFHTTAMCSPTRAALLTGRNHHAVGVGTIPEMATGFPGYLGGIRKSAATLPAILRDHGYGTYAVGKWHLTPSIEVTAAGPFDSWPLRSGFDRFYGFMGGVADQWKPELVVDNQLIDPPTRPGYHLSEDLVDQSIRFVDDHRISRPDSPFLLYLCFGACHAPLQVPRDYVERYRGRYDRGWDETRMEWFARQKKLGIVPAGTMLAPRNPGIPAWTELSAEEQRVCARMHEVYAGFMEHADAQIGRLAAHLRQIGVADRTLIVVLSDNGAAKDGGRIGNVNTRRGSFANSPETIAQKLASLEDLGGASTFAQYPAGWAQVGNTPLKWYKTDTYAGGTRVPFILHWPGRIAGGGGIRTQYHHAVDVLPTILHILDAEAPSSHGGIAQLPVHGTEMTYTFDDPQAPTRKTTQYYEMLGDRALWHDGWAAVTIHTPGTDFDSDRWELYHSAEDFSECRELSAKHPEKLREMIERWWTEAGKYDVLPLDDRLWERHKGALEPAVRNRYVFRPAMTRFEKAVSPAVDDRSHTITADVIIPEDGADGVLLASGGRFGGYVFYVRRGRLAYTYNFYGIERQTITSESVVPAGQWTLRYSFTRTDAFQGLGELFVETERVGSRQLRTMRQTRAAESLYCGREGGSPVGLGYDPPFEFTGEISRVVVEFTGDSPEPAAVRFRADLEED